MDESCRNALKRMKLSHLIALFEEKQIDYETLQLFHEYPDTIPSIISNIGDQLKLRKGIKSILEENEIIREQIIDTILDIPVVSPSTSTSQFLEPLDRASAITSHEIETLAAEAITGERLYLEEVEHNNPIIQEDKNPVENYIYGILQKTALGKAILELYRQSVLDNNARCKLAELVIQAEYGADTNKTICGKRFVQLAKWTVECFPTEFVETYYIPSSERGKGRSAAGKLYDAYTNLNKELRKVNLRKIISGKSSRLPSSELKIISVHTVSEADDLKLKKNLEFLEVQLEPWEQIKECWEYTSFFRLSQLRDEGNKDLKVSDYINKYPVLKQPGGHLLLEYDFKVLFEGAENRMLTHWPQFSVKIKQELINSGIQEASLDCEAALLFNYPKLFSVVPVKVPNRKPWRASRAEIQEGFLVHLKIIGDFEKQLEGMKKTVQRRGTELQLFPLIVSENLKNITASYVVLDDRPIRVESPLRAIEVSFKAYHALHCKYPIQSERLWIVIEKALYGIQNTSTSILETTPEMIRLITVLKCE